MVRGMSRKQPRSEFRWRGRGRRLGSSPRGRNTMGDPMVMQLVSRVLDSGCTPEEACEDTPELLAEVRERLRRIRSVDAELDGLFPETESALLHEAEPSDPVRELPQVP